MQKEAVSRGGYRVTVRRNSIEALNTFQNQPDQFDLVITDQTMPGMTGSDLARRMLQDSAWYADYSLYSLQHPYFR